MSTKLFNRPIAPVVLIALFLLFLVYPSFDFPILANASTSARITYIGTGGDCHAAFHAEGDTYWTIDDPVCGTVPGPVVAPVQVPLIHVLEEEGQFVEADAKNLSSVPPAWRDDTEKGLVIPQTIEFPLIGLMEPPVVVVPLTGDSGIAEPPSTENHIVAIDQPVESDTNTPDIGVSNDGNKGNPGNDKNVGNAGEKCDKGMCENPDGESGEHGNSDNLNKGNKDKKEK